MLKIIFFLAAALFFFAIYFHNIIEFDQDLGRHLLTGQIIWQTHQVPKTNLFSYTYPNYPFINSHWLSEVIFYLIGVSKLLYFKTAILVTTMTLTVFTAYRVSKNLAATALSFVIFAPVLLERTEIRPEIFSYLFISIFMYILLLKPKLIWLLPLLQIFWVNMHIYFILGPILALIFLRFKPITFLVFLATLFNPNVISGAIYPLTVFNNYGYSIVENQNIFFLQSILNNPNILYFEIAAVLFLISFLLNWKNLSLPIILNTLFIILPVWHIRSFPLFFLLELPIFALNLSSIKFLSPSFVFGLILLTLFAASKFIDNGYYEQIGSSKKFGNKISAFYEKAADFILANNLSGPIFNDFDLGSYLDYRLYPAQKVFVDGRPEAYPASFFQKLYIPMQESLENFVAVDKIYNFNLIIFSRTDITPWGRAFLNFIPQNKKYKMVYLDDFTVIFVNQKSPS